MKRTGSLTRFERRADVRYTLRLPLDYTFSDTTCAVRRGQGVTCDISRHGLSFESPEALPVGGSLELVVCWPAPSPSGAPMRLIVSGRILRSAPGHTAVRMLRCGLQAAGTDAVIAINGL